MLSAVTRALVVAVHVVGMVGCTSCYRGSSFEDSTAAAPRLFDVCGAPWSALNERCRVVERVRPDVVRGATVSVSFVAQGVCRTEAYYTLLAEKAAAALCATRADLTISKVVPNMTLIAVHPTVFVLSGALSRSGPRPQFGTDCIGGGPFLIVQPDKSVAFTSPLCTDDGRVVVDVGWGWLVLDETRGVVETAAR